MAKRRGHGEGGIYQRESDGRWCATVDLGYVAGKRKRKVVYGETRKEVADKLKKLHRDQAGGMLVAGDRQTVGQYLDHWLTMSVTPNRRAKTADIYERIVRLYLKPHLGKIQLTRLEPAHVQTMLNFLLASSGEEGKPLSARTVHHVRAVLRRALNQAIRWGIVARNAAALAEPPRVEQRPVTVLDAAQGQKLLATVAGHQWEALYYIALLLGLREGELLGLRWQDVDFDRRTLRVAQTVQRIGKQLVVAPPKTAGSQRTIPLPSLIVEILRSHAERQAKRREALGDEWDEHGFVFPTGRGTPVEPRNLIRHFKQALKYAELPNVRFHDLRHSCATMLITQGIHPRTVMEILGHSQISVTMNTYGHIQPEVMRAASDAMDRLFTPKPNGAPPPETDGATVSKQPEDASAKG
jgi:integrase